MMMKKCMITVFRTTSPVKIRGSLWLSTTSHKTGLITCWNDHLIVWVCVLGELERKNSTAHASDSSMIVWPCVGTDLIKQWTFRFGGNNNNNNILKNCLILSMSANTDCRRRTGAVCTALAALSAASPREMTPRASRRLRCAGRERCRTMGNGGSRIIAAGQNVRVQFQDFKNFRTPRIFRVIGNLTIFR